MVYRVSGRPEQWGKAGRIKRVTTLAYPQRVPSNRDHAAFSRTSNPVAVFEIAT
jgi:hypothetical protein